MSLYIKPWLEPSLLNHIVCSIFFPSSVFNCTAYFYLMQDIITFFILRPEAGQGDLRGHLLVTKFTSAFVLFSSMRLEFDDIIVC